MDLDRCLLRLPDEIVVIIIGLAAGRHSVTILNGSDMDVLWVSRAVCRRWRDAVDLTPSLWCGIMLSLPLLASPRLAMAVANSGVLRVALSVVCEDRIGDSVWASVTPRTPPVTWFPHDFLRRLWEVEVEDFDQLQHLTAALESVSRCPVGSMPMLTSVVIGGQVPFGWLPPMEFSRSYAAIFPNLRVFKYLMPGASSFVGNWLGQSVTRLDVPCCRMTDGEVHLVLSRCPSLAVLSVQVQSDASRSRIIGSPIVMDRLRELTVVFPDDYFAVSWLFDVSMPNVTKLSIISTLAFSNYHPFFDSPGDSCDSDPWGVLGMPPMITNITCLTVVGGICCHHLPTLLKAASRLVSLEVPAYEIPLSAITVLSHHCLGLCTLAIFVDVHIEMLSALPTYSTSVSAGGRRMVVYGGVEELVPRAIAKVRDVFQMLVTRANSRNVITKLHIYHDMDSSNVLSGVLEDTFGYSFLVDGGLEICYSRRCGLMSDERLYGAR